MLAGSWRRQVRGPSTWLVGGLAIQAGTTYLTLVIAGRSVGAADFGVLSALYVVLASVSTGLFLPVEQEIARRRGAERGQESTERTMIARASTLALVLAAIAVLLIVAGHQVILRVLGDHPSLVAALCVALPGYALCFVSRGVFAGSGELPRYGVQLGAEGTFRLLALLVLVVGRDADVTTIGWLFGLAPWVALVASFTGRRRRPHAHGATGSPRGLSAPLGLLLFSSLASQLLVNAGPVVVALFAEEGERAQAGAFLAALVVVRVPVFLFTAVAPSFLPAIAHHAASDRKDRFVLLTRRVLRACALLTVVSCAVLTAFGPPGIDLLFGFSDGVGRLTFLALGASVGMFLAAAILAQCLLGQGHHAAVAIGWAAGLVGLAVGTAFGGSAVDRATVGFLLGSVVAAVSFAVLLRRALDRWSSVRAGSRAADLPVGGSG